MKTNISQLNRVRSTEAYALSFLQHAMELARTVAAYRHTKRIEQIRFVIFGQGRCGSTLLETLLDSHPEVTCQGELLRMRHLFPLARLERFERVVPASNRGFGFHLKPWHVTRVLGRDLVSFTQSLDEHGYKFIHLQRANWFLQSLSQVKLHLHHVVHATSDDNVPTESLIVDPEMLVLLLKEKEELAAEESAVVSNLSLPAVQVVYEEDLVDPARQQITASRIFAKLGLPDASVDTPLRKVSPRAWRLGVSNVEEVAHSIRSAGFGRFLEEA